MHKAKKVCTHRCTHTDTQTDTHTHTHIHTHTCTHTHARSPHTHTHTPHTHTHTHTRVHTHAHRHTEIHTPAHTRTAPPPPPPTPHTPHTHTQMFTVHKDFLWMQMVLYPLIPFWHPECRIGLQINWKLFLFFANHLYCPCTHLGSRCARISSCSARFLVCCCCCFVTQLTVFLTFWNVFLWI